MTNQTVAFGFVQAAQSTASALTGMPLLWTRIVGLKGTQLRAQRKRQFSEWLGQRLLLAFLLGAFGLSLSVLIGLVIAQAVAGSLFSVVHQHVWRRFGADVQFESGDGI